MAALVCAAVASAQALGPVAANLPKIGDINVYGLHKLTPEKLLADVNLRPGGPLPPSKGDLEDEIEALKDVVQARVEAICCDNGAATLFVGIEEKGEPHAAFRSEPGGEASLPEELTGAYKSYLAAVQRAADRGSATEDFTAGHSFSDDPDVRLFQDKFAEFARDHVAELRDALRTASDPDDRAVAATVIGYVAKKVDVQNDLQYALSDPDETVRANAMRSLDAFAVLSATQPQLYLKVSPTWFIELLHSVVLSDRIEASRALVLLTDKSGQSALDQLRERAIPDLVEMAHWKTLRYALPPFVLLGRLAGLKDEETQKAWEQNQRDPVIDKALALLGKRKGK